MMIKQVIVFRTKYPDDKGGTRKLRRGKEMAQASHASMAFLTKKIQNLLRKNRSIPFVADDPVEAYVSGFGDAVDSLGLTEHEIDWINGIFTKICLQVETEEQLLEIQRRAVEKGLQCHLITDRGLTEFKGVPTNTCLAIGPDKAERIDEITMDLELY
jgi:peptidyl-tRNA hydrolase, PTH2 family